MVRTGMRRTFGDLPVWADRPFTEIRRSDVAALLDAVEDHHSAWLADQVLVVAKKGELTLAPSDTQQRARHDSLTSRSTPKQYW